MQISFNGYLLSLPPWAEFLFRIKTFFAFYAILAILLTTSSFYFYFAKDILDADGIKGTATDNKFYLGLWLLLYGITGGSFLFSLFQKGLFTAFFFAVPIIIWVLFSFSWSVSSDRSLYFGMMFIMQVFIAYMVAVTLEPKKFVTILIYTLAALLLLSLLGFIIMPEKTSLDRYGGGWLVDTEMNGVFSHKSDAGYFFACLIVLLISVKDIGLKWFVGVRSGLIFLGLIGIMLANSATALGSAIMLVGLYILAPFVKNKNRTLYIFGLLLFGFALSAPYIDIGQLAVLIGRDPGLTGRSEIWAQGIDFISGNPIVGYGYYGFFDTNTYSPVWEFWGRFKYFLSPHFHNSGLDVVISLGVVGLVLYMFIVIRSFSILYNTSIPEPVRLVLFLVLLLFVITSTFDFTFMKHNHFSTFFLFYVFFLSFMRYGRDGTLLTGRSGRIL